MKASKVCSCVAAGSALLQAPMLGKGGTCVEAVNPPDDYRGAIGMALSEQFALLSGGGR